MEETYQIRKSLVENIQKFLMCVSNSRKDGKDDAVEMLEGFSHMAIGLLVDLDKDIKFDEELKRRWETE